MAYDTLISKIYRPGRKVRNKMKYYKKTAALVMGFAIAFSAAAPSFTSFAEDAEDEDFVVVDNNGNVRKDDEKQEDVIADEGDFRFSTSPDGNVTILSCNSHEETLTLPVEFQGNKITGISGSAFTQLSSKKIIIPAAAEFDISENPFAAAVLLEEFEVEEGNKNWTVKDGVLFSKDMKTLISYPAAKQGKAYTIPEGTEEIGIAAFYEADIEELTVSSTVKKLNRHCFSYLKNVKEIDLSEAEIETIPAMAFVESQSLTDIRFPKNLYKIEIAAFMNCKALASVELPDTLENVGQSAFMGTGLTEIVIPDSVTSIGYNAFGYVNEESDVTGFEVIGSAGSAAQTYASDSDPEFDYKNDFSFTTTESYNRRKLLENMNVQTSGEYNYAVNDDGTAILVGCDAIDYTLTVPDEFDGHKVTYIFANAFMSCISKEIILPDSVTKIGENVFSSTVERITLPGNLTEFESDEPFISLSSLKSLSVGQGDGNYSADSGVLYNKDKSLLVCYPQGKEDKTFTAPSGLKYIALSSFCYNKWIEEVDLSPVELISDYAFEGCTAVKNVKLSKNLKSVGQNAFLGCEALTSIRVYKVTETIGQYAFGFSYDADLEADIRNNPENYADDEDGVVMPYSVVDGFRMYVDKDSVAEKYASDCGIETVTNSVTIGKSNVDARLFYILGGAAGLGIIGVLIKIITGKAGNKKKKAK